MTASFNRWVIPDNMTARDIAIHVMFPDAKNPSSQLSSSFRGGRQQALAKLSKVNGGAYGKTRNFLNGEVTHLSPYLRHGCITVKEAATAVHKRFGLRAQKLLYELAWREYWRNVWYAHGMDILQDMHVPKVELSFNALPNDIQTASTGLPCMDSFVTELAEVGYLHNHARMWLASYVVHWRKTDWQDAAFWMHDQLIDGDYASNHLSWQWVASTFSSKPYVFNQESLAKYTDNRYCYNCTANCPFQDSYANLEQKLFKPSQQTIKQPKQSQQPVVSIIQDSSIESSTIVSQTIVWVHDEMLNSEHSLLKIPHEKIFIFDPDYYQGWSINRLRFIADCLAEMPNVHVWLGKPKDVLKHLNVKSIITQNTPNNQLKQWALGCPTKWHAEEKVCQEHLNAEDIKSFSRFWKVASESFTGNGKGVIRKGDVVKERGTK